MKTIEQMAEEAGFVNDHSDGELVRLIFKHGADEGELARFAALVRAEALEEAAVICDELATDATEDMALESDERFGVYAKKYRRCAFRIRAAKEAKP